MRKGCLSLKALLSGQKVRIFRIKVFKSEDQVRKRKNKKIKSKKKRSTSSSLNSSVSAFNAHSKMSDLSKQIDKIYKLAENFEDRIQDIEVHVNLLTRLLTTLCIEKFGMRIGVLKRLIKRIEKEVIRDSQILHLEALYKLPLSPEKKGSAPPPSKNDPWDEIS